MENIIKFVAEDPYFFEVSPKPVPASQTIPQWWKDATPYLKTSLNPDGNKVIVDSMTRGASFKKCTPMLDSITSGYVFPLWADVQVRQENGMPTLHWRVKRSVFSFHGSNNIPTPTGYNKTEFKYHNGWIPKLPKGYSAFITPVAGIPSPIFKPISAIIDYDSTPHQLVPPGYIQDGFEGIIEKGTPMFQLTPFKRENWISEFDKYDYNEFDAIEDRTVLATIINNYVKNVWHKKSYK
jgi:hypothetical protein